VSSLLLIEMQFKNSITGNCVKFYQLVLQILYYSSKHLSFSWQHEKSTWQLLRLVQHWYSKLKKLNLPKKSLVIQKKQSTMSAMKRSKFTPSVRYIHHIQKLDIYVDFQMIQQMAYDVFMSDMVDCWQNLSYFSSELLMIS